MNNIILRFREVDRDKFNDIVFGRKTIETRAATVKYKHIQVSDNLIIVCGKDRISKSVQKVERYNSLEKMLENINFKQILPSVGSKDEAIRVWDSFPDYKEKIKEDGIIAFYL